MTALHYTSNLRGDYTAALAVGFNLMDVSNKATMDALPAGAQGLYWVGNGYNTTCSWDVSDSALTTIVTANRGDSKFCNIYYIADEPHTSACPTGPTELCNRTALIKSIDPSAKTFAIIQDGSTHPGEFEAFAGAVDYIGVDPYPFNINNVGGADLNPVRDRINTALNFVSANRLVPVFQTFGQECATVAQYYRMPTAAELRALLAIYDELIPKATRPFDFAYTWGAQGTTSCPGLQDDTNLRSVMQQYFAGSIQPPTGVPPIPVYIASGVGSNVVVGTNPTPSYPTTGIVAGNLAILETYRKNDSSGTLSPPSGWTSIGSGSAISDYHAAYYKVLDGTESGAITVTSTGTTGRRAAWIHVFGANGGAGWAVENFDSEASASGATVVLDNNVITTGTNRLAVNLIGYTNRQTGVARGVVNAASASLTDVQSAVNTASDGDIVKVPAGTATWSSSLNINDKSILLQGAGSGTTGGTIINYGGTQHSLVAVQISAPPPPVSDILWTATAQKAMALEWASGVAYDVAGGEGTSLLSSAWNSTTRVQQITSSSAKWQRAYQITTRAADRDVYSSGAQRTELGQGNPSRTFDDGTGDRQMRQGDEVWIAYQLMLPASFPTGDWIALQQNKCAESGNGPLSIYWWGGKLLLEKSQSQTFGSENVAIMWTSPTIPTDTWIKIMIHVKWSSNSDGFYELFGDMADGQGLRQLVSIQNGWTLKYGSTGAPTIVGPRIGVYRGVVSSDSTAYFCGFTVAKTRAAAQANAF